jgi:hypothetical protein
MLVLYLFFPSLLAQVCRGLTFTFTDNIFHVFYSSDLSSLQFQRLDGMQFLSGLNVALVGFADLLQARCFRNLLLLDDLLPSQTSASRAGCGPNVAQTLEVRMIAIFVKVLGINCKLEKMSFFYSI